MKPNQLDASRRRLLAGIGAAAVGTAVSTHSLAATAMETKRAWDHEVDIVCVGGGAASCASAVFAAAGGASVMLVEKQPMIGGTTLKSGGIVWIPNNFVLRKKGVDDKKLDCLRYMARFAFPDRYDPQSVRLGLTPEQYGLLETYYDNATLAIDKLQSLGAVEFEEFRFYGLDTDVPDYADHLPENKVPVGRALQPVGADIVGGGKLIESLESWLVKKKVPMLMETRVTRIIMDAGRVSGVEAVSKGEKKILIRARRGVIFGTGGFSHNLDLLAMHQPSLYGACAMPGSTGDFIPMAQEVGAKMGGLHTAWRAQVVLEEALENRAVGAAVFAIPGDSTLLLNKYGRRVVNEKRNYNDRTQSHFVYDPAREEYPNHLQFLVFDARALDIYGGAWPLPADPRTSRVLIQGDSLETLAANVDLRLASLAAHTGGVRLGAGFASNCKETIRKYNEFSIKGIDADFGRGATAYDREWSKISSPIRPGSQAVKSKWPNATMHPLADHGPYYCIIVGAGALDTSGGPMINTSSQILDAHGQAIRGLYGAGNCVASISGRAYFAAGATIGPAMTFGFIAANHALREKL